MIAASLGFTLNSALVKALTIGPAGAEGLDVFQIAFARALFSFALLLPFLLRAGRGCLATRHPVKHGIRAVAGAVALVCSFHAVGRLHLSDFTALSFTQPPPYPLLAVALLGAVLRWPLWVGTPAGVLRVCCYVRSGLLTLASSAPSSRP